jgi:hypothetical protein
MRKKNKIDGFSHVQPLIELKKNSINRKPNIRTKFRPHHWISDDKNFETRPHLTIFLTNFFYLYFFFITVIYFVIARTKRVKCRNTRTTVGTSLCVVSNNKCGVGQTYVIIDKTRYYYSQNNLL